MRGEHSALHRGNWEGQYFLRHCIWVRGHTQSYPIDTLVLPCWVRSVPHCRNTDPQSLQKRQQNLLPYFNISLQILD